MDNQELKAKINSTIADLDDLITFFMESAANLTEAKKALLDIRIPSSKNNVVSIAKKKRPITPKATKTKESTAAQRKRWAESKRKQRAKEKKGIK